MAGAFGWCPNINAGGVQGFAWRDSKRIRFDHRSAVVCSRTLWRCATYVDQKDSTALMLLWDVHCCSRATLCGMSRRPLGSVT
jgi:hypothetical protein